MNRRVKKSNISDSEPAKAMGAKWIDARPPPEPNLGLAPLPSEGRGNAWTSGLIIRGSFEAFQRQNVRVPTHLNPECCRISFLEEVRAGREWFS